MPTEAQINAGRWLVSDIKNRYEIKEILGHKDLTATACPGKNFDIGKLLYQIKWTVCIGTYDTKAEAIAVAGALKKLFDDIVVDYREV